MEFGERAGSRRTASPCHGVCSKERMGYRGSICVVLLLGWVWELPCGE
jgi:hypothetical protein